MTNESSKPMIKFRIKIMIVFLLCLVLTSCIKKHKFTVKLCDTKLFVEVFNVNPFGVDEDYLTDSLSFRKYIGDSDNEHENYSYSCKGASVYIMKTVSGNRWAKWDTTADGKMTVISNFDTIENLTFSISKLKKLDNY